MRRRRGATACALVVAMFTLAGCALGPSTRPDLAVYGDNGVPAGDAPTSTSTQPTGPGGPGQQAEFSADWAPCTGLDPVSGRAAEFRTSCAAMYVPMDYTSPRNGRVYIDVARAIAPALPDDAPPLVVLINNGPFDATLSSVASLPSLAASLPSPITDKYSIIGIDIRGAGASPNVDCFRDYPIQGLFTLQADLTSPDGRAHLNDVARQFTFGCQDDMDANMVFFNTTSIADDLDSLRSALGADTLDLLGVGYGATVGTVYLDRYPGHAGRVVLDSPVDHAASASDRASASAQQYERATQAFLADCATQPSCPMGADPQATLTAALAALDHQSDVDDLRLNSGAVLWALVLGLPDRQRWPDLAAAIAGTAAGDDDQLARWLDDIQVDPTASLGLKLMIDCNDTDQRLTEADVATAASSAAANAPLFGSFLVGVSALCRQWPAPEAALGAVRAEGAPTAVLIGGVDDPVAAFAGVQALSNQLKSAVLVNYAGTDHGGYLSSDCVAGAVNPFLVDGVLPVAGTLCGK